MIIDSKILSKYNLFKPYFVFIQDSLDQTLMNYSKKNLYAYTSRIKKLTSTCEKIESGRYSSWNEIDDFVGCVIIVPKLGYEDNVIDFLKVAFIECEIRKKGSTFKNYDIFRFDSTRFIGKLKPTSSSVSPIIFNIKFEIQIRSAFEHAWSVTTHDFAYKTSNIDWQMLRLAAQLKSSVEQLDMIALSAKDVSKQITKYKWPEIDIKIEILNFFKQSFNKGKIPNEIMPKDFSRVIDNIYTLIKSNFSMWKPLKWKIELKTLIRIIDNDLDGLNSAGFPMGLSLYQIVFGILAKHKIIKKKVLNDIVFFKSESFNAIFPELKTIKLNEFEV